MVTKFSGKFDIIMLKKHRKFCRCGLTHLDATPTFKNCPNIYAPPCRCYIFKIFHKVHVFWERHKILQNLHSRFVLRSVNQMYGGNFAKFCDLLKIYQLWLLLINLQCKKKSNFAYIGLIQNSVLYEKNCLKKEKPKRS